MRHPPSTTTVFRSNNNLDCGGGVRFGGSINSGGGKIADAWWWASGFSNSSNIIPQNIAPMNIDVYYHFAEYLVENDDPQHVGEEVESFNDVLEKEELGMGAGIDLIAQLQDVGASHTEEPAGQQQSGTPRQMPGGHRGVWSSLPSHRLHLQAIQQIPQQMPNFKQLLINILMSLKAHKWVVACEKNTSQSSFEIM
ncbi:uncharacterized protein LOC110686364 isoform X1 [Chenopodium quinoa]|uniref:uncharacterized protein LOC110686364 isoform X1 n=1 Tax=Chenopodium quinoa TaxID=63459 RepID=UPI000B76E86D|nr:uncharacterized protein LOC110686364 isoform X1 [Chenopodium quinoa]